MHGRVETAFRCNPEPVIYDHIFTEIRTVYDRYTMSMRHKTQPKYGRKSPAWITAKYGLHTTIYVKGGTSLDFS